MNLNENDQFIVFTLTRFGVRYETIFIILVRIHDVDLTFFGWPVYRRHSGRIEAFERVEQVLEHDTAATNTTGTTDTTRRVYGSGLRGPDRHRGVLAAGHLVEEGGGR